MLRLLEMFGCVLACRRIATANVAARLTLVKRYPKSALNQALLASVESALRGKSSNVKPAKCSHDVAI
jgi:predicted transcriptional regulator